MNNIKLSTDLFTFSNLIVKIKNCIEYKHTPLLKTKIKVIFKILKIGISTKNYIRVL